MGDVPLLTGLYLLWVKKPEFLFLYQNDIKYIVEYMYNK